MNRQEIQALIPVRDPYLFIDEVVEISDKGIHARKQLAPDLDIFAGHYVDFPVFPGALQCECAFQAAAVLIAQSRVRVQGRVPVIARVSNVKFRHMVRPGDTLEIHVELTEQTTRVLFLKGRLKVDGKTVAQLEFAATEASLDKLDD